MIIRVIKNNENPYVMINKHCIQDKNLSWKAKGLLAYLLSLPDDWQIYQSELQKHATDGKDSLKKGIEELINNHYIIRSQIRNIKGQLSGYEYQVFEVPTESGFSGYGFSDIGESATTNNYSTNNNPTNTKGYKGILPVGENSALSFSSFLNKYPELIDDSETIPAIKYYLDTYKEYTGKNHPSLKPAQWQNAVDNILCSNGEYDNYDLDQEDIEKIIDKHFITEYNDCDWNILHFLSGEIMKNRYYEVIYNKD